MKRWIRRVLTVSGVIAGIVGMIGIAWMLHFDYALNAGSARLETGDVERFRRALRSTVGDTARDLQTRYLDEGSRGLSSFAGTYALTGDALLADLRASPERYAADGSWEARIRRAEPVIRAGFREFERLYPPAIFPPVWFLVGGGRAGGANGHTGLFISVELDPELPCLVLHELTHFNHAARTPLTYFREWSNLARAIKEGAADFVAELASGCHTNPAAHAWARGREAELWAEFRAVLTEVDTPEWWWGTPVDGRPRALGYYLGYRIVQSYYARSPDKTAAIRDILSVSDYDGFLRDSGYDPATTPSRSDSSDG